MSEPTNLAAIYNAAEIILWVEDGLTKAYLGAVWDQPSSINFHIGGGHETLKAVVEAAREYDRDGVLCLRDRDFGPTNRPQWHRKDTRVFSLETFEVECFMLDPKVLAACRVNTGRRTEQEIEARLHERAGELLWWMACRKVIADLRGDAQKDFPAHPKRDRVVSRETAEDVLLDNDWVKTTAPGLTQRVAAERLREDLLAAHEHYARHLAAGTWPHVFSGKELLGELLGWLYTKNAGGKKGYEDVAKAVAEVQLAAGRVPAELLELRDALLARLAP